MKIENHLNSFSEHRETIFEWGVRVKGIKNSQRVIGLHCPRAIIDLLSAYLLETSKIDVSTHLNHRWFKAKNAGDRIPEFPNKNKIISMIRELELLCENLAYGSPQSEEKIKKALELFNSIEKEIMQIRKNE